MISDSKYEFLDILASFYKNIDENIFPLRKSTILSFKLKKRNTMLYKSKSFMTTSIKKLCYLNKSIIEYMSHYYDGYNKMRKNYLR